MPLFIITVIQISQNLSDPDDRADNPAGEYRWDAVDSELALDQFHRVVPIGCLDDFEISIKRIKSKREHDRTIKELVTKMANIRQQINDLILSLPDNQLSKKVGKRCFTINLSDLLPDTCLSAETYDFRHQYEAIVKYIDTIPVEKIYERLYTLFMSSPSGIYWLPGKYRMRLHPIVVKNVKEILEIY